MPAAKIAPVMRDISVYVGSKQVTQGSQYLICSVSGLWKRLLALCCIFAEEGGHSRHACLLCH